MLPVQDINGNLLGRLSLTDTTKEWLINNNALVLSVVYNSDTREVIGYCLTPIPVLRQQ